MSATVILLSMVLAASESMPATAYPYEGPAERPVAPLHLHGVCPGECCNYGDWMTTGNTTVHVAALDMNDVLVQLPPRTSLIGLHGFIHLTRVGTARAARKVMLEWRGDAAGYATIPEGDQVTVLDHLSEGFWRVWYEGRIYQLPIDETEAPAEMPSNDPQRGLSFVRLPRTEWWAAVRLPAETRIGWINMDEAPLIKGVDGCGG